MEDFLQILIHTVQGLALWAVLVRRKPISKSTEKYFVYYILFVVANDLLAKAALHYFSMGSFVFYNLYDIISYYFMIYWFHQILPFKKMIKVLGIAYTLVLIISLVRESFFHTFLILNVYGGSIIVLIMALMYYHYLLQKKEPVKFTKLPSFWITSGWLLFNIGIVPIQLLFNFGYVDSTSVYFVMALLNILLYGSFTIAFLCYKKN